MRILVVSKGSGTGAGASEATHYVARRKDEPERQSEHRAAHGAERAAEPQPTEATRLFSVTADSLGHRRANLVLGDGQVPATRDVMHLVISFAHEEDFLALGTEETQRQTAVRELTRATLEEVRKELGARELHWVAGLHRNTDNPHVHLLLQREYIERETGVARRMKTLPAALRVRWEKDERGARQIHSGGLAQTFERLLEERLARAAHRPVDLVQERLLLGRAMLAQEALDRLTHQHAELDKFGNTWRSAVTDATGRRQSLTATIARAQNRVQPLAQAAEEIHTRYAHAGQPAPTPQLSQTALNYLQDGASARGDAARLRQLETIRTTQYPTRTASEMARLTAQQVLAEARWHTEQAVATKFTATRQLVRWEIPVSQTGVPEPIRTTLAATERALRWESDQANFLGQRQVHWNDERRAAARLRVAELTAQRSAILAQIAARQAQYDERMAVQQTLAETLTHIHAGAAQSFEAADQPFPPPQFTHAEMQALDRLAARRGDPAFYRALIEWERDYDARQFPDRTLPFPERVSRARARNVMAEIAERTAAHQWQNSQTQRAQTDVLLPESSEEKMATARLADVLPKSRLARAFPFFTTNREPYQTVAAALAQHEQRLSSELTRATETRRVLSATANEYAANFGKPIRCNRCPRQTSHSPSSNRFRPIWKEKPTRLCAPASPNEFRKKESAKCLMNEPTSARRPRLRLTAWRRCWRSFPRARMYTKKTASGIAVLNGKPAFNGKDART